MKRARPVEAIVIAAPVPSPMPLTAPVNVVVPAAVPDAIVRSLPTPVRVLPNRIDPPPLLNEVSPTSVVVPATLRAALVVV